MAERGEELAGILSSMGTGIAEHGHSGGGKGLFEGCGRRAIGAETVFAEPVFDRSQCLLGPGVHMTFFLCEALVATACFSRRRHQRLRFCARFDRTVSGRFAQTIRRTVPSARSTLKASRRFFHPRDPAGPWSPALRNSIFLRQPSERRVMIRLLGIILCSNVIAPCDIGPYRGAENLTLRQSGAILLGGANFMCIIRIFSRCIASSHCARRHRAVLAGCRFGHRSAERAGCERGHRQAAAARHGAEWPGRITPMRVSEAPSARVGHHRRTHVPPGQRGQGR